jgi:hypothetical protein
MLAFWAESSKMIRSALFGIPSLAPFRERVEAFMALADRALAAPVGSLMRDKLCHNYFMTGVV